MPAPSAEQRTALTTAWGAAPVAAAAPGLAAVTSRPTDATTWAGRLNRLIALETRRAVAGGMLTAADAEELLGRPLLVIDQAITPTRP